jgi:hypothetical protein
MQHKGLLKLSYHSESTELEAEEGRKYIIPESSTKNTDRK